MKEKKESILRLILGIGSTENRLSTLQLALKQARRLAVVNPNEIASHHKYVSRNINEEVGVEEMDVLTSLSLYLIVLDQLGYIFGSQISSNNRIGDAIIIANVPTHMNGNEQDAIVNLKNSINHNFSLINYNQLSDIIEQKYSFFFVEDGNQKPIIESKEEWEGDRPDKDNCTSFHVYPFSLINYAEEIIKSIIRLYEKGIIQSPLSVDELTTRFTIIEEKNDDTDMFLKHSDFDKNNVTDDDEYEEIIDDEVETNDSGEEEPSFDDNWFEEIIDDEHPDDLDIEIDSDDNGLYDDEYEEIEIGTTISTYEDVPTNDEDEYEEDVDDDDSYEEIVDDEGLFDNGSDDDEEREASDFAHYDDIDTDTVLDIEDEDKKPSEYTFEDIINPNFNEVVHNYNHEKFLLEDGKIGFKMYRHIDNSAILRKCIKDNTEEDFIIWGDTLLSAIVQCIMIKDFSEKWCYTDSQTTALIKGVFKHEEVGEFFDKFSRLLEKLERTEYIMASNNEDDVLQKIDYLNKNYPLDKLIKEFITQKSVLAEDEKKEF